MALDPDVLARNRDLLKKIVTAILFFPHGWLAPAIHVFFSLKRQVRPWMPGTKSGMTGLC
ncbi:MAG: hypothetical protein ACR2K5_06365 [Pseudolabrys sp.]